MATGTLFSPANLTVPLVAGSNTVSVTVSNDLQDGPTGPSNPTGYAWKITEAPA